MSSDFNSCPGASDNVTAALLPPTLESTESSGTTLAWDKQKQLIKYTSSKTVRLLRTVSTDCARSRFYFPHHQIRLTYCHLGRRSFWLFYATEKPYRTVKKLLLADPAHVFLSKQVPSHIPEIKAYYRFPYIHWQNPTYLTIFFFTHKNKYRTKVILDWKSACNWKHGKQTENFYWNSISNCYYYRGSCYKLEGYCKQLLLTGWNEMFGDWENWKIIFYQVVNLKMKFPIILPLKPASKETPVY